MRQLLGVSFVGLLVTAVFMLFTSFVMGLIFEEVWVTSLFTADQAQAIPLWGYPALFVVYFLMAVILAGGLKWLGASGAFRSVFNVLVIGGVIILFQLIQRLRTGGVMVTADAVTDGVIMLSVLAVAGVVLSQFQDE